MMLPEGRGLHPGHGKLRGYVRFFNLSTGAFVRVKSPFSRITASSTLSTASSCCRGTMTLPSASFTPSPAIPQSSRRWRPPLAIDPPQQEGTDIGSLSVPSPKLVAKFKWPTSDTSYLSYYYHLVECNSEILVIGTKWHAVCYSVYRLADLMLGRTVPLTSIDGNALFIGRRSVCISSKVFPTIVPDTIVMRESKIYLSQYHLSSGTLSQATDGVIAEEKDIPGPYSIMCHIITCCSPPYWNKGKILCKEMAPKWRVKKKFRYGRTINPA
ncbi:unnamed protein product [Miscanthus lutarioriparius]|uniref:Uncharacterized protein n=2 Tax=Panicoideae TaxID=147369 RepID=A0A811R3M7_9POAL|nr:unnamed protein product [Miscanthus lutarioriparius]